MACHVILLNIEAGPQFRNREISSRDLRGKSINKVCGAIPLQERAWRVGWVYQKVWQSISKEQEKCSHIQKSSLRDILHQADVLENSQGEKVVEKFFSSFVCQDCWKFRQSPGFWFLRVWPK